MPEARQVEDVILCVNSGSSSLKFALYRLGGLQELRLAAGAVEQIGLSGGRLWIQGGDGKTLVDVRCDFRDFAAAVEGISSAVRNLQLPSPAAAGHRVVHGGPKYSLPQRVD